MLTFDYQCSKCDFIFTYLQRGDIPPPWCPECRSKKIKKIMTSPRAINYNGPWSPRFRRGLTHQTPSPFYPMFCDEDFDDSKPSVS